MVRRQMVVGVEIHSVFKQLVLKETRSGSRNITDTSVVRKSNLFQCVGNVACFE